MIHIQVTEKSSSIEDVFNLLLIFWIRLFNHVEKMIE